MDLEDLQSHLHALKKLYGLLINDVEYFQNHRSEILDEKARFLLKDLLDGAAEKVLNITSEVLSTNLGVSNTCSVTQQQKPQESPELPFLSTNASNTSPNDVQRTDKDLSSQVTDLSTDRRTSIKQTAQPVASEQSQVIISIIEPQNRKKRCRVCQRSTVKQMKSTEQRKFSAEETQNIDKAIISLQPQLYNLSSQYQVDEVEKEQDSNSKAIIAARSNEKPIQRRIWEFQSNPSGNEFSACLSNNMISGIVKSGALQNFTEGIGKKLEDTDFISKEASDVIKIIESHISALQVSEQCQRSAVKQMKSTEQRKFSAEETQNRDKAIISLQPQLYNLSGQYQVDEVEKEQDSNSKVSTAARSNERPIQRRIREFQSNPSGNEFSACLSKNMTSETVKSGALQNFTEGIGKKLEDTDFISKEAFDAIKIIESRFSALQVGGKHVDSLEKQSASQHGLFEFSANSVSGAGSVSLVMLKKKGLVTKGDQTDVGQFVIGRNDLNGRLINRKIQKPKDSTRLLQVSRQMVNPLIEIKLPNQSVRNSAPLPPCNDVLSKLTSQNARKDDGISLRHDTLSQVGESSEGHILGTQKASVVPVQNVKAIVESHNFVQGHRIPLNLDKSANKYFLPAKLPSETNKENVDGNRPLNPVAESTNVMRLYRKKQAFDAGNKLIRTQTRATAQRRKGLSHRTTTRKNPQDKKRDQLMVSPIFYGDQMDEKRGGVKKKINHGGRQRTNLSDQQESGDTSSGLRSSSSWTTHQGSTSYYDSEEYSLTGQSRSQQRSGSTTSSEIEVSYHRGRPRGHHSGHTSDIDNEMYSVPSRTQSEMGYSSSSENGGYLPSDQTSSSHSIRSPSRRLGPRSNYRSANRKRSEKRIGRLRKLKDKLAIIFHHHHHHHHHHHYSDEDDYSDQHSQRNRGTSLWKHAGKLFHWRGSDEVYGEQAAEKLRKSVVHNVRDKKQGGNFHTLVDGFVRHVRHSKKSKQPKPSKGSIGRAAKSKHVGKKVVKKVHWWQMLRRHGGMKVPRRPRVKLRFGSKKPQLQTLRTIKWG